jgi:hypothetical protein
MMLTETTNLKPMGQFGEKYWVSKTGDVYKMRRDGALFPISTSGTPPRARFYFNGKETRLYVKYAVLQTWGVDAAMEYERKHG